MQRPPDALIRRNIAKYYVVSALGGFAFFYNTVETLYYRHFDLSFAQIGGLISAGLLLAVIMEVPSGAFADLYGKRRALIVSAGVMAVGTALVAFGSTFPVFLIGFACWGIGRAFASGAASALLFDTLKALGQEASYIRHSARLAAIFISVDILSAGLSPALYALNVRLPYFVALAAAALGVAAQVSMVEVLPPSQRSSNALAAHLRQMAAGFRLVLGSRALVWLAAFSALITVGGKVFAEMINAPFLVHEVGYSLGEFGLIVLIGSAMQSGLVFFADRLAARLGERRSLWVQIIAAPLVLTGYAFARWLPLAALLTGAHFAAWSFSEVVIENAVSQRAPDEARATVLSITSMLVSVAALVSLPVLGAAVDRVALPTALIGLAVGFGVGGAILLARRRDT